MSTRIEDLVPAYIRALTPYAPGMPVEELERAYGVPEAVKLASNENPLGPSPRALAAVQQALGRIHRYPDGGAYHLRRRLAERLGVGPGQLIFGNGSNEIIDLAARAFLREGTEAVVPDQAFVIYRAVVQAAGARAVVVPLRNYTIDLEAMAAAVTPATRVLFVANPSNPTGTIYRRAEWERFLDSLPAQVVVVADDAYAEYVEEPDYPASVEYVDRGRWLIALRTFSKAYGLAGLRLGYGVARAELVETLDRIRQPFNVNTLAQVAALAALDDAEHLEHTRAVNRAGMQLLAAEFARRGLEPVPSEANFLLVRVGPAAAAVHEALLRSGVIVRPMKIYGFPEHIRVTVGVESENRRLLGALDRALRASAGRAE